MNLLTKLKKTIKFKPGFSLKCCGVFISLLLLASCGDQETSSLPTTSPRNRSTPTPRPTSSPTSTPTPGPRSTPLPAGEVPSTVGGTGSITTNRRGGSVRTANDIDALLDSIPATVTITVVPGMGPVVELEGDIRLPNGSVDVSDDFYFATVSPGGLDINEPVEDVCQRAPIRPGGTCRFEDVIPAFPGTFTLDYVFTDGEGIEYTTTRTTTIVIM